MSHHIATKLPFSKTNSIWDHPMTETQKRTLNPSILHSVIYHFCICHHCCVTTICYDFSIHTLDAPFSFPFYYTHVYLWSFQEQVFYFYFSFPFEHVLVVVFTCLILALLHMFYMPLPCGLSLFKPVEYGRRTSVCSLLRIPRILLGYLLEHWLDVRDKLLGEFSNCLLELWMESVLTLDYILGYSKA